VLGLLGATAAQALLGSSFRITKHRGEVLSWRDDLMAVPTVHPSSILRLPDEQRQEAYSALVADLKVIADQAPAR
jgi:DNA polymerase